MQGIGRRHVEHASGRIGEQNRRPIGTLHEQASRKTVERGKIGTIERVERGENIERRPAVGDFLIDGHRNGANGRDVLTFDVCELAAPGRPHTERRDQAKGQDGSEKERRDDEPQANASA